MLKIAGVILCILGTTGYGMLKVTGWKRAIDEMEQWILLFEKMKSHIYYHRDVITDICCRMDEKMYGIGGKYVADVGRDVRNDRTKSFRQIWEERMEDWARDSELPDNVKKIIFEFPEYVGEKDYEQQINHLDFFLNRLKKEQDCIEKQMFEKRKPVMAVSIVSGITISVLLL